MDIDILFEPQYGLIFKSINNNDTIVIFNNKGKFKETIDVQLPKLHPIQNHEFVFCFFEFAKIDKYTLSVKTHMISTIECITQDKEELPIYNVYCSNNDEFSSLSETMFAKAKSHYSSQMN